MSAIAGILRLDGAPVARHDLERMANALRPYGPDRADILATGPLGLVHVLMRMTPEDRFDRQPLRGPSGAVITADLRLDNREEILARLGVPIADATAWPDSRVLLAAWERFGDDLWPALRGPFAAAVWEPQHRTLTLARDHVGLNVVMWHRGERCFAFATMPKALFALPEVPRVLNEEKLADFLVLNFADHETTFHRDVFRIRPAHVAKIASDGRMTHRRYWSAADIRPIRLGSDDAYAQAAREQLDRAVRRQMRSAHPVGCFLSGGLDSSSVAMLAARALGERGERLAAFTQVPREGFDGPVPANRYADETPYVEAVRAAAGNIDVTYVRNDQCDDFADLERVFLALEGPVLNPTNAGWVLAILRLARAQNRRVLLAGTFGNLTVSWTGWSQAAKHLLDGRLVTAFRQWNLLYRLSSHSRWLAFRKLFIEPLVPEPLALWADRRRHRRQAPWMAHSAIRPEFAAQQGVAARARSVGHDFLYREGPDTVGWRLAGVRMADYLGDWSAAEKAIFGVETRMPTVDVDVIAFCLGIPDEQFLAEEIDRSLIRRAMWGLLPGPVVDSRRRGLQAADWFEKVERQHQAMSARIAELRANPLVQKAIDLDRLERAIRTWPKDGWGRRAVVEEYQLALTRGFGVARYLAWIDPVNRRQPSANEPHGTAAPAARQGGQITKARP